MSVKYDVYKTPNPKGEADMGYHVRAKYSGVLTTRAIAKRIEHDTSLTAGDVMNVLASLSHIFVDGLGTGQRIYLDGIGSFSLAIEAPAAASPRELRAEQVRVKGVYYQPDGELKAELSNVEFERTQQKSHSAPLSDEEVKTRLKLFFADHVHLRRTDFQRLCGFTRSTAVRRLKALLDEGFLVREGSLQSPVYLKRR